MSCVLDYVITGITGDCSSLNAGGFSVEIYGDAPDYTIQWVFPNTDIIPLGAGVTGYTVTNLSAGTYTFNIIDSCTDPVNTFIGPISVYISSGTCVSITSIKNTLCNFENGSITANTQYNYGGNAYELYSNTLGLIESTIDENGFNNVNTDGSVFFNDLKPGTYYVVATDGGGCSGVTSSVIIQESSELDFNLFVVNDAGCSVNSGKIFVTDLTGRGPYTYLWSNGETTDSIEGLSEGAYSVTVTDTTGCEMTKTTTVDVVPPIGQSGLIVNSPSCFASDGKITLFISGGTAPYYYSGSNGFYTVSFANYMEYESLPAGDFSFFVQDAGLCSFVGTTTLLTQQSFDIISIDVNNSVCNDNSGEITVQLSSGTPPYTYKLTSGNGYQKVIKTTSPTNVFSPLVSGDYTLTITDNGGCTSVSNYTVLNESLFTLSLNTTNTTCGLNNGSLEVTVTDGVGPFLYEFNGQSELSNLRVKEFTNLGSGSGVVTVTDTSATCKQSLTANILDSKGVDFITNNQNPTNGNNGSINVLVVEGKPPFTYQWSSNVGAQTGPTVTNLVPGTYTIKVTDSLGCVTEKEVVLGGGVCTVTYELYSISEQVFENTGSLIKKGLIQMLNEGYYDLTLGDNNCILNEATFEVNISVNGVVTSEVFYTGYTLSDVPSDTVWANKVRTVLLGYEGIGDVSINLSSNDITITTDCESNVSLLDSNISVFLMIHYDISCETCTLTCTYPPTNVCVDYRYSTLMTVDTVLDPSTQILQQYDGGVGPGSNYFLTWRVVPKTVSVSNGCFNSYWAAQDPSITDPTEIATLNTNMNQDCEDAKKNLYDITEVFKWSNNFIPKFQINKFYQ